MVCSLSSAVIVGSAMPKNAMRRFVFFFILSRPLAVDASELKPGNSYTDYSTRTEFTLGGAISLAVNEVDNLLYVAGVNGTIAVYALDPATAPPAYSVSGTVRNALGVPATGITVNASGPNGSSTAVTDSTGLFTLIGLPAGVYSVAPAPGAFSFTPVSIPTAIATQNITGLSFQQNPPVTPGSYALSPWTTIGPSVTTTGTVTLNQPAPAGGAVIALTASNPQPAKFPATVTVPAGQSSAIFSIQGTGVGAATTVTLTATFNGGSANTTLTVSPGDKITITGTGAGGGAFKSTRRTQIR